MSKKLKKIIINNSYYKNDYNEYDVISELKVTKKYISFRANEKNNKSWYGTVKVYADDLNEVKFIYD